MLIELVCKRRAPIVVALCQRAFNLHLIEEMPGVIAARFYAVIRGRDCVTRSRSRKP